MLMSEHQQIKIKLLRLIIWSSAHSHNPPTKFCANPVGYSDVILLTSSQKPGRFPGLRAVFQTSHTTFHFCQRFGRRCVLIKMWFLSAWNPPIPFGRQIRQHPLLLWSWARCRWIWSSGGQIAAHLLQVAVLPSGQATWAAPAQHQPCLSSTNLTETTPLEKPGAMF